MWNTLRKIYVKIFSSNLLLQKINNGLLDLVLSARGYNNHRNFIESGEEFFIKKYLSNKPTSICIDVGASEGNYTNLLLKETFLRRTTLSKFTTDWCFTSRLSTKIFQTHFFVQLTVCSTSKSSIYREKTYKSPLNLVFINFIVLKS